MDNKTLQIAEKIARDEFAKSSQQPADWRRLAGKLEAICKEGGSARMMLEVNQCRRIAADVENLKNINIY